MIYPPNQVVTIDYTNYRGERGVRRILPISLFYGVSAWHQGEQWILMARDIEKGASRDFAMKDIHSWSIDS